MLSYAVARPRKIYGNERGNAELVSDTPPKDTLYVKLIICGLIGKIILQMIVDAA